MFSENEKITTNKVAKIQKLLLVVFVTMTANRYIIVTANEHLLLFLRQAEREYARCAIFADAAQRSQLGYLVAQRDEVQKRPELLSLKVAV